MMGIQRQLAVLRNPEKRGAHSAAGDTEKDGDSSRGRQGLPYKPSLYFL